MQRGRPVRPLRATTPGMRQPERVRCPGKGRARVIEEDHVRQAVDTASGLKRGRRAVSLSFRPFSPDDRGCCLALFDANCPEFFVPAERADYSVFLDANPPDYQLCLVGEHIAGAFGLLKDTGNDGRLNWILLDPGSQGLGIGTRIMQGVCSLARERGMDRVHIAASHRSSPFFERFGARTLAFTENGWGESMHRVDMLLNTGDLTP